MNLFSFRASMIVLSELTCSFIEAISCLRFSISWRISVSSYLSSEQLQVIAAQQAARANSVKIFFIVQLIYWLNIFESLEVLKWEKRPPEQMGSSLR